MKKKDIRALLSALKNITITTMEKEDQFAIIDNIIALSEESERLSKIEEQALSQFKPENLSELPEEEQKRLFPSIEEKFSEYMKPKYNEECEVEIKPISDKGIDAVLSQKESISTGEKALVVKHLRTVEKVEA